MTDIETGRIIDLLESRELEDIEKWLKVFKNIKVISRDGSITYKNASTNAHPEAIQVSDRFHILKNLTEYGRDYLKRLLNKQVLLSDESKIKDEIETKEEPNVINKYKFKTKWDLIVAVKELKKQGYRIIDISEHLGISPNTVVGYNKVLEKDKDRYLPMNESKVGEHKPF